MSPSTTVANFTLLLGPVTLVLQRIKEKENLKFKPVKFRLKN